MREAGVDMPSSCEQGACGTCLATVIEGVPDHQDVYLNDAGKAERHEDHDLRVARQDRRGSCSTSRGGAMITLYDYELSGNCYKLRLLMSILGVDYKTVPVDFYPGREHKSEWFLKLNPLGQLPVIEDDGLRAARRAGHPRLPRSRNTTRRAPGIRATIRPCSARSASGWPLPRHHGDRFGGPAA